MVEWVWRREMVCVPVLNSLLVRYEEYATYHFMVSSKSGLWSNGTYIRDGDIQTFFSYLDHCRKESNPTAKLFKEKKEESLLLHPSSFPRTTAMTVNEQEEKKKKEVQKGLLLEGALKKGTLSLSSFLPTFSFFFFFSPKSHPSITTFSFVFTDI